MVDKNSDYNKLSKSDLKYNKKAADSIAKTLVKNLEKEDGKKVSDRLFNSDRSALVKAVSRALQDAAKAANLDLDLALLNQGFGAGLADVLTLKTDAINRNGKEITVIQAAVKEDTLFDKALQKEFRQHFENHTDIVQNASKVVKNVIEAGHNMGTNSRHNGKGKAVMQEVMFLLDSAHEHNQEIGVDKMSRSINEVIGRAGSIRVQYLQTHRNEILDRVNYQQTYDAARQIVGMVEDKEGKSMDTAPRRAKVEMVATILQAGALNSGRLKPDEFEARLGSDEDFRNSVVNRVSHSLKKHSTRGVFDTLLDMKKLGRADHNHRDFHAEVVMDDSIRTLAEELIRRGKADNKTNENYEGTLHKKTVTVMVGALREAGITPEMLRDASVKEELKAKITDMRNGTPSNKREQFEEDKISKEALVKNFTPVANAWKAKPPEAAPQAGEEKGKGGRRVRFAESEPAAAAPAAPTPAVAAAYKAEKEKQENPAVPAPKEESKKDTYAMRRPGIGGGLGRQSPAPAVDTTSPAAHVDNPLPTPPNVSSRGLLDAMDSNWAQRIQASQEAARGASVPAKK